MHPVIFRHNLFPLFNFFFKNLFEQTQPRTFARFSPKLNQMIYRQCWPKVIEFKLIRLTFFEYIANKFNVELAKIDSRCYLRNGLTYSHQTWCVITTMVWSELQRFGALLITFQPFVQNVLNCSLYMWQSMPSLMMSEWWFWVMPKLLYFKDALTNCYKSQYVSSGLCPEGAQKVLPHHHYLVKCYNDISKNANNL